MIISEEIKIKKKERDISNKYKFLFKYRNYLKESKPNFSSRADYYDWLFLVEKKLEIITLFFKYPREQDIETKIFDFADLVELFSISAITKLETPELFELLYKWNAVTWEIKSIGILTEHIKFLCNEYNLHSKKPLTQPDYQQACHFLESLTNHEKWEKL